MVNVNLIVALAALGPIVFTGVNFIRHAFAKNRNSVIVQSLAWGLGIAVVVVARLAHFTLPGGLNFSGQLFGGLSIASAVGLFDAYLAAIDPTRSSKVPDLIKTAEAAAAVATGEPLVKITATVDPAVKALEQVADAAKAVTTP